MSRLQRIEFEILDCAINRANNSDGYTTTVNMFLTRLEQLFPDMSKQELKEACKGLVRQKPSRSICHASTIGGQMMTRSSSPPSSCC